ncbi:MAG: carboxypeptidase regulatory-like domain-containing protein, partial [Acidobacteria bacterium]|nr:carboxypeptidase regulatory-like domain-containing protein [Acidobacteriota bacterium]
MGKLALFVLVIYTYSGVNCPRAACDLRSFGCTFGNFHREKAMNPLRRSFRLVLLATTLSLIFSFLIIGNSSPSWAQLPVGVILGVVRDSTGAVLQNASITANSTETGYSRTATSGLDGSFRIPALPAGSYEVRVSAAGFQTGLHRGMSLAVGQEAVINFSLVVGAIEQTVEVVSEAPLVNTTSGSVGGLVDERSIEELPLNGRNYLDLTLLQVGVQEHKNIGTAFPGT